MRSFLKNEFSGFGLATAEGGDISVLSCHPNQLMLGGIMATDLLQGYCFASDTRLQAGGYEASFVVLVRA